MENLINLDKLNEKVRSLVEPYCKEMLEIHQDNIKAMFIYGSAATEDFIPKISNVNIFMIMTRIDPPDLKKSLRVVDRGIKKGITAPLMLTLEHVNSSTDTFPIEFLEMKETHILIYGEDILKNLEISLKNIRHQCEQQIKGGLVRLYQTYLEIGMKEKQIKNLLINSITSFIPVFRNILRLKGKSIPKKKKEVIETLSQEFSLKKDLFIEILELKAGIKLSQNLETVFGDYLEEIEKLGIQVDKMQV